MFMLAYRKDIDGLRAIAIIPVVLFHADFKFFSGGYVGVDVFFVISGYLITSLLWNEVSSGRFSFCGFYNRRARRILPALYVVIAVSFGLGYFGMMPDEYKNFGQSAFATTLFSNNMLLAVTSGYWDLASSFKPLLHTWSLGVEEQYYIVFPAVLILIFKIRKVALPSVLAIGLAFSLALACCWVNLSPNTAFYVLPTRAWELLLGALAAAYRPRFLAEKARFATGASILGFLGFLLVVFPFFLYGENTPSPSYTTLVPTVGAFLVILFGHEQSPISRFLGSRALVGIGLISYSLYLWHQPLFAFMRVYCAYPPTLATRCLVMAATAFFAVLSWRFIEAPFRDRKIVGDRMLVLSIAALSAIFLAGGLYLNSTYGMANRVYDRGEKISDMDKRLYNERAFKYKADDFRTGKKRVLVVGNSFARDAVNMIVESLDPNGVELLYRDDLPEDISSSLGRSEGRFFEKASVILFAYEEHDLYAVKQDVAYAKKTGKKVYFLGTKHFGYNLNWIIHIPRAARGNRYNALPEATLRSESLMSNGIPRDNYISMLAPVVVDDAIPITDSEGRMLSADRLHLTKYGALFFGIRVLRQSKFAEAFASK